MFNAELIEGFELPDLELILDNKHLSHCISLVSGGTIIIDNCRPLRCVKNYYTLDGLPEKNLPAARQYACKMILSKLNLTEVNVFDCQQCQRRCLELHRQGLLSRKISLAGKHP